MHRKELDRPVMPVGVPLTTPHCVPEAQNWGPLGRADHLSISPISPLCMHAHCWGFHDALEDVNLGSESG